MKNQCDGCNAGLPLKNGIHRDNQSFGIACTKGMYQQSWDLLKAKNWWKNLPADLKAKFPSNNPTDDEVIVWYQDPEKIHR